VHRPTERPAEQPGAARPIGTGIKHARLRVYASRRPNFSPKRSLPGVFVPRRTPREYVTTEEEEEEEEEKEEEEEEEERRGDENQLDRGCHSIVTDIPRRAMSKRRIGEANLPVRTTDRHVFTQILIFTVRKSDLTYEDKHQSRAKLGRSDG